MSHVGQVAVEPPREAEGGFLSLMRHRNYALLWTGQLISQTGDRLQWVVISLWVYAETGSALSVSYAIMALMIGPAAVGVLAGALVDQLDRRKILIYGDLVRALFVFAIPNLMELGLVWVYLDLFLISAASAFFRPAMFAAIPQSVPKDRLLQANAFFGSMDTSTEVFGPVLAGVLTALSNSRDPQAWYGAAIYINAVSYLISAVFVSALRLRHEGPARDGQRDAKNVGIFESVQEGFRYIRADRLQIALLAILLMGQWVVGLSSLQTPLAKGVLAVSDRQFGWFQSIWGIGFVSGALLLGWYGGRSPRGKTIIFAYLLWALATGVMGLSANYGMLVIAGFWVGFANMLMFVSVATALMEHTPSDKIGRTLSTRQIVLAIVRVVALLGFGWLADLASIRGAILAMAALSFVGTLGVIVRFPALRSYRPERLQARGESPVVRGEPTDAVAPPGLLRRYLETHTDPEFIISEQRSLNAASLVIVLVGWLSLLTFLPVQAMGVLVTLGATVFVAALVRTAARRLEASHRGQERGRGGANVLGLG